MRSVFMITLLTTTAMALSACSGNVKQTLGLGKEAPDEFKVVSNQPLSVPPDFRLTTPVPGAKRPQQQASDVLARSALFNDGAANQRTISIDTTAGEAQLLARANAHQADPNIRELLKEQERVEQVEEEERGFFSKLFDFSNDEAPAINATQEKKRIIEAQQKGEVVTGDDVAVQEEKDTGIVGKIFGY